jgi:hypothetical protein
MRRGRRLGMVPLLAAGHGSGRTVRAMGNTEDVRQLRIILNDDRANDHTSLSVFARVYRGGNHRDRLLLSAHVDHRLGDFDLAHTLRSAGELLQQEAFRMAQPAPQAPRKSAHYSGRVATLGKHVRPLQ